MDAFIYLVVVIVVIGGLLFAIASFAENIMKGK